MIPNWLSLIDIAFVLTILLFAWGGFQRGFAAQIAHILTFLAAGILLFVAYPHLYSFFGRLFRRLDETVIMYLLIAGLAVLSVLLFILFSKLLASAMKTQISERSDHVYGLVLGLVRGTLAAFLFMIIVVLLGPWTVEERFNDSSYSGRFVCRELVPRIRRNLSRPIIQDTTRDLRNRLMEREEAGVLE